MGNAKQLLDRLVSFNVDTELARIMFQLEDQILDLVRKNQLFEQGIDKQGNVIGVYSKATEIITKGRKKSGEPWDLFDTGSFYRSFKLEYGREEITIFATDAKLPEIFKTIEQYGLINNPDDIIGFTVSNEKILNYQYLLPRLQKRFRNVTGL